MRGAGGRGHLDARRAHPRRANPSTPAAAIAPDGSDVLAFVDAGGVEASVRPPGAPDFGPPQTLAPPPPAGGATRNLALAQVPNGATIAAWTQDAPTTTERISWAERPPAAASDQCTTCHARACPQTPSPMS